MNSKRRLTGTAIAAAAAGMFALGANVAMIGTAHADTAKVKCTGVNACKGKSDCKTAKSECKGHNACKGHGFKEMSKADCDKARMSMKKK